MRIEICSCFVFLLIAFGVVKSQISGPCLKCICEVEGCDKEIGKCKMDAGSLSCGPYQIKKNYWIDCGKPGKDYETCTKAKACSERCVRDYMKRYGKYCTGGKPPTCQDYARIHNGGPNGCNATATLCYWSKVKACLHREPGAKGRSTKASIIIECPSTSAGTEGPSTSTESPSTRTESPSTRTESLSTSTESTSTRTESPSTRTESPSTRIESPSTRTESASTSTGGTSTSTTHSSPNTGYEGPGSGLWYMWNH